MRSAPVHKYRNDPCGKTLIALVSLRLFLLPGKDRWSNRTTIAGADAVIFATRLDMAPEGMQEMMTKIVPVPGAEPGTYTFKATFGMAGHWQLSLGAKVQGETGTV